MHNNNLNIFAHTMPSINFETVLNSASSVLPVARVGCYAAAAFLAGRKIFQGTASAACKLASIAAKNIGYTKKAADLNKISVNFYHSATKNLVRELAFATSSVAAGYGLENVQGYIALTIEALNTVSSALTSPTAQFGYGMAALMNGKQIIQLGAAAGCKIASNFAWLVGNDKAAKHLNIQSQNLNVAVRNDIANTLSKVKEQIAKIKKYTPISLLQSANNWSCRKFSKDILTISAKIAGAVTAINCSILLLNSLTGNSGWILHTWGLIDTHQIKTYTYRKVIDLRIPQGSLLEISSLCFKTLTPPIETLENFLRYITPQFIYKNNKLSDVFISVHAEEIIFRSLIQRTALPALSSLLPTRLGEILNHKVSRILIASGIFALTHRGAAEFSETGVMPQLAGGIILGTIAELDNSLVVPILSHFFWNALLGLGADCSSENSSI